jgi:2-oxoglutarate ferredoxin oxidoreductase subunit delta
MKNCLKKNTGIFRCKEITLATLDKELVVNTAWCTGCGICAAFCPRKVLEVKHEKITIANPDACVKCANCELRCPDYAIFVREVKK